MFGYVTANKPELKMREYARYKGFYCGLCRRLYKRHGRKGQITLTYDMTFLVLLLTSLYEPATTEEKRRCLIHPTKRQYMLYNDITDYAADMNVLLSANHLRDDWEDERRISGLLGTKLYAHDKKNIEREYPRQAKVIEDSLSELSKLENEGSTDIDAVAGTFGKLLAEIFVWREDALQSILRSMGFYLGKYIYILDAYMDLDKDIANHSYNPFVASVPTGQRGSVPTGQRGSVPTGQRGSVPTGLTPRVQQILDGTLRLAIAEFEKLPLEQDLPLLRNILYEGVWLSFNKRRKA